MKKIVSFAAILFVLTSAFTCGKEKEEDPTIYVEIGVIKYMPPPDNCNDYMIIFEKDDQIKYNKPDNLSDDYKIDGLQIKVTYRKTEEKHNCGFGGYVPIINIIKIENL